MIKDVHRSRLMGTTELFRGTLVSFPGAEQSRLYVIIPGYQKMTTNNSCKLLSISHYVTQLSR